MGFRRELGRGIDSQFRLELQVTSGDTIGARGGATSWPRGLTCRRHAEEKGSIGHVRGQAMRVLLREKRQLQFGCSEVGLHAGEKGRVVGPRWLVRLGLVCWPVY